MSDYLDGELGVREHARMERHVSECRDCHALLLELKLVIDQLHLLPPPASGGRATQIAAAVRVRLTGSPGS
jgi:anti-sigma factor RsiW